MRIYVADSGDTLTRIAVRSGMDLSELMSLNPHISSSDRPISGSTVYLAGTSRRTAPRIPISMGSWIPHVSPALMAESEYDVIVVGTGAGGGAAIRRLCEHWRDSGKKIGVVEAGGLLIPTNVHNIATMEGEQSDAYYTDVSIPSADPTFREVIALGGRTLMWNAVSPRMYLHTFEGWPVSDAEMVRYYNIAEQAMRVTSDFTGESRTNRLLLNRLWQSRYIHAMNEPIAVDLSRSTYGIVRSNVYFSSISFLAEAMRNKPFDLALNTRAVKILTEGTAVTGVRVMTLNKQTYDLKAKTVVLSTSTIETPRLLLYSGIPGRAIGHYLTTHTGSVSSTRFNPRDLPSLLGTVAILVPQIIGQPFQVQIEYPFGFLTYHDPETLIQASPDLAIAGIGTVQPQFENRIELNPYRLDAFGVPEAQIHMQFNARDLAVQQQAEHTVAEIAAIMGVSVISTDTPTAPVIGQHASGTCRMGDDPSTSAVNRYGQVHGIYGLYVADNSMIPVLGAANPTLTTVALSIRTADYIAGQL